MVKLTSLQVSCQSPISCLLYTVRDLFSVARQSSFQNNFHTLLFVFWWTKSQHPRSRLRKRLNGEADFITGQLLVTHLLSLVYSSRPVQRSKTVQFPKQFSHTSLCFLVDQVVASQIKTEEEALWVKPCGSAISHPSFANSSRPFSFLSLLFSFLQTQDFFKLQVQV